MKQRLYILTLGLLLGVLLLTACQTELLPGELGSNDPSVVSSTDSCYVNLHIVNASQPTTRATAAEENAIYDGILCIFEGTSESAATLKTATVIDQLINNPGSSSAINVIQRLATGTHNYESGKNLYVLALLNTTAAGFRVSGTTLQFKNTAVTGSAYANIPDANSDGMITLSDIQTLQIGSVGSPDEHVGLFMSNAVQDGGGRMPLITTTGDSKHTYDTEDDARAVSANHLVIKVERAAARVKVINTIPANTVLQSITLSGASTTHPLIHKMSWVVTNYNEGSYAVANGSTDKGTPTRTFAAKDFTYFHQHSLQSGEEAYIGENYNATKTQVVVEVQLKDGSFLLGDCFNFYDGNTLYTSTEALINYYKSGWEAQKSNYTHISSWNADAVFRNATVTILDDGTVKVRLLRDAGTGAASSETGLSPELTTDERTDLNKLENTLESYTKAFRDGKMYYTYDVATNIVRNNAYNLSLVEEAATDMRHATITFKANNAFTPIFSEGVGDLFSSYAVNIGSNLELKGMDNKNNGQQLVQPNEKHNSVDNNSDYLMLTMTPASGWTFTPSSVIFSTTRYGTNGGVLNVYWVNSGDSYMVELETGINPYRDNAAQPILYKSYNMIPLPTGVSVGAAAPSGLCLLLYSLDNNKQVGFSDFVINGTLEKVTGATPQKSISGIGRPTP